MAEYPKPPKALSERIAVKEALAPVIAIAVVASAGAALAGLAVAGVYLLTGGVAPRSIRLASYAGLAGQIITRTDVRPLRSEGNPVGYLYE